MSIEEIIETLEGFQRMSEGISGVVNDPERKAHYAERAQALREAIALLRTHPEAQPNEPLTLEELREMDGKPVWGADGQLYIVNVENDYAADKHRGFRMLWTREFFYRRPPKED